MNFFEPQLFNLNSVDGKSASEFPIVYYFVAILFKCFGVKLFLLKWVHLAITYLGVIYLFRFVQDWIQDYWYSFLITLLLFSSTVFNYYAFNYLPDTAALGFTFIGLFFVNRYRLNGKMNFLYYSFLFLALSSLIKITFLIYPITFLIIALYLILFSKKHNIDKVKSTNIFISSLAILLVVISWNIYTIYYNSWNHSSFFLYKPIPLWEMSGADIAMVWTMISEFWYSKYLAYTTHHLLWVLILIQLIRIRKTNQVLTASVLISFLGFITYIILFFRQFQNHDYYIIVGFPLFILFLIQGILSFKTIFQSVWVNRVFQITIAVILIAGMNYSRMKLNDRFNAPIDNYSKAAFLIAKNKSRIELLKIPSNAKIVVGPDESNNGSLLYLNRKGWTIPYNEQIHYDAVSVYKKSGATHFVLTNSDAEKENLLLQFGTRILKNENLSVFKLK